MQTLESPLSSGVFDRWIYAEILHAALGNWTAESYIQTNGSSPYRTSPRDSQVFAFLASCCLVSTEWLSLARPLLYAAFRTGEFIAPNLTKAPSHEIIARPSIAPLVRYVGIHSYDPGEAAEIVSRLPLLPNLSCLIASEGSYPCKSFKFIPPYQGQSLTKLDYRSGSVQDLARLMSVLPHLKELKAGSFMYAMRYVPDLFEWMFRSSKDSIQHFTILRSPKIFKDTLGCFINAKSLTLELRKITNEAKINMDLYELATNLARFPKLEKLTLRIAQDSPTQNLKRVYASLGQLYPRLEIQYQQHSSSGDFPCETDDYDACQ
ncbi:hypothetical protein P389DRAFT_209741 [Cystobasidium minutum MCA 4210]|uniref:uncharacterized protein n=1 Tax=Cystobasidium minutum MCA 4210 TaxID=1397322 RepID=UPI0034D02216|eukprot:jgi/Rhomi1/209741/estExt_Genemark1.C_3_t10391